MRITTSLLPTAADSQAVVDVAVVIDVLRATSVMATALQAGADRIVTCRDVSEAKAIAQQIDPPPLLCGERGCVVIPGFDLGNSPSEYTSSVVGGKTIVLTTTNGTAAIETAVTANEVIAASFLNLAAVVQCLNPSSSIGLICAGTDGMLSNEDVLLAGAIIAGCQHHYECQAEDDSSVLAHQLWRSRCSGENLPHADRLADFLRETRGGRNLAQVGFDRDIRLCGQIDSVAAVPRLHARNPNTFRP